MNGTAPTAPGVTVDTFLGGRVEALQHATGHHRAGLEAVLLAVSLDSRISGTVADLGAGVGVAGFCAAARCRHARVVLVERNAEALACARAALERPANAAFADRVRIAAADITAPETERAAAGMGRDLADHVLLNPPFHLAQGGTRTPAAARGEAHVLESGGLDSWFRAAASVLKFRGDVTVVFRADGARGLALDEAAEHARALAPHVDVQIVEPGQGLDLACIHPLNGWRRWDGETVRQ